MSRSKSPFTPLSRYTTQIHVHVDAFERALKPLAGSRAGNVEQARQVKRLIAELESSKTKITHLQKALCMALFQEKKANDHE